MPSYLPSFASHSPHDESTHGGRRLGWLGRIAADKLEGERWSATLMLAAAHTLRAAYGSLSRTARIRSRRHAPRFPNPARRWGGILEGLRGNRPR